MKRVIENPGLSKQPAKDSGIVEILVVVVQNVVCGLEGHLGLAFGVGFYGREIVVDGRSTSSSPGWVST